MTKWTTDAIAKRHDAEHYRLARIVERDRAILTDAQWAAVTKDWQRAIWTTDAQEIADARQRVGDIVSTFATSSRDHHLKMRAIDDLLTLERHLVGLAEPC
mgnify:CR=1 FL=1